jgi:hypothetical protein
MPTCSPCHHHCKSFDVYSPKGEVGDPLAETFAFARRKSRHLGHGGAEDSRQPFFADRSSAVLAGAPSAGVAGPFMASRRA